MIHAHETKRRQRGRWTLLASTFSMLIVGVACSKREPSGASQTSATVASATPPSGAPMMKEYKTTSDTRLGKEADGMGLPVGTRVPEAHARDLDGREVALSSLVAKGPTLLVFYRGGWCPYCNFEIHALTNAFPQFQSRHVTPVAISVDRPDAAAKTRATYAIPFPVLSDSDAAVLDAFHVARHVDDAELAKLKEHDMDLEAAAGNTHHVIAVPSLFLVDRTGTIRWAHVDPEYAVRPSIAQILAAIDASGVAGQ